MAATDESTFLTFVGQIIHHEGGYVNDPDDPGGETMYGISRRAHPEAWRDGKITLDEVIQIYREEYWEKGNFSLLHPAVALMAFDFAVNAGVSRSVKKLQEICGVTVDGILGPVTASKANKNPSRTLERLAVERTKYYASLSTFSKFGTGWLKRTFRVYSTCRSFL